MKAHKFIGSSRDDVFCIKGVDLFRYKWYSAGECSPVVNPENGRLYSFSAYYIN